MFGVKKKTKKVVALQVFYMIACSWSSELAVSEFPVPKWLSAAAAHL